MDNQNMTTRLKQLQKIQEGLGKHLANVGPLTLDGVTVTIADLAALIQADLDAMDASAKARAASRVSVQAERDAHAKALRFLRALKAYVIATFGKTPAASSTLEDFGYKPHKGFARTPEQKAEAKAKAAATRKARHTMGPKQKKLVTGDTPSEPIPPKA
jgi:hypothetical protein